MIMLRYVEADFSIVPLMSTITSIVVVQSARRCLNHHPEADADSVVQRARIKNRLTSYNEIRTVFEYKLRIEGPLRAQYGIKERSLPKGEIQ